MIKKITLMFFLIFVCNGFTVLIAKIYAMEKIDQKVINDIETIDDLTPDNLNFETLEYSNGEKEKIQNLFITFSTESSDGIKIQKKRFDKEMEMNVPSENIEGIETDEGIYYDNEDYSVLASPIAIGVSQKLKINNNYAPHKYDFSIEGENIKYIIEKNGSVTVLDNEDFLTSYQKPWAVDSSGKNLETYYYEEDGHLYQYINFDESTTFPIVADPIVASGFLLWACKVLAGASLGWLAKIFYDMGLHKACKTYGDSYKTADYVCDSTNHYRD